MNMEGGELAFIMDGKIYIFDESFYQTYKSTKDVESLIDDLIPSLFPKSLDLANTFKSINKRLEDKFPHYLKRYLIEKGEENA